MQERSGEVEVRAVRQWLQTVAVDFQQVGGNDPSQVMSTLATALVDADRRQQTKWERLRSTPGLTPGPQPVALFQADGRELPLCTTWHLLVMRDWPQQNNGYDCGVFTLLGIRYRIVQAAYRPGGHSAVRNRPQFSQQHIAEYRRHLVDELTTGRLLALPGECPQAWASDVQRSRQLFDSGPGYDRRL